MKETEIKLDDAGFEEIPANEAQSAEKSATGASGESEQANRPDLRLVQVDRDKSGNPVYTNVGGMWKNVSKGGKEFYVLRIGKLKLLAFPNDRKSDNQK